MTSSAGAGAEPADDVGCVDLGAVAVGDVDVIATWSALRRGGADPTFARRGRIVLKAWSTASGPLTMRISQPNPGDPVAARAWGPGIAWLTGTPDRLPLMFGALDDPTGFEPRHDVLRHAVQRWPGVRVPTTGLVIEAVVPSIIEQRVTGREAFTSYRRLVRRYGEPAPGPAGRPGAAGEQGLVVAPTARQWALIPSWEWLRAGVDPQRSDTAMRALRVAASLERCVGLPSAQARARLMSVPGLGVWTAAEVAHIALGDADAVSFGDYHVARNIGMALTGEPIDDAALEVLLRPYAGHRYRVQRYIELLGVAPQRRGARRTLPSHLPTTW